MEEKKPIIPFSEESMFEILESGGPFNCCMIVRNKITSCVYYISKLDYRLVPILDRNRKPLVIDKEDTKNDD